MSISIICWRPRPGESSGTSTETQTDWHVTDTDGGSAVIKAEAEAESRVPPDNICMVHHHFMMTDGSRSHCKIKGCNLVFWGGWIFSQPAASALNYRFSFVWMRVEKAPSLLLSAGRFTAPVEETMAAPLMDLFPSYWGILVKHRIWLWCSCFSVDVSNIKM